MSSLPTPLRRQLEGAVRQARKIAEAGARHALEVLAVHEAGEGVVVAELSHERLVEVRQQLPALAHRRL